MISKLQYISQGNSADEQHKHIHQSLDRGVEWIQLRWKNADERELTILCEKVKALCERYRATFIVNDYISAAKYVDADGVHLGLEDESIANARTILGRQKIIGGTANTLEQMKQRIHEKCDYIGLGPFRFTPTKEKLSPILGLQGYDNILKSLKKQDIACPPVFAIGGVNVDDIEGILETGVYGVALSGLLTRDPERLSEIKKLLK